MPSFLQREKCWNHASREAACRCPLCNRSYCRECVTEHENRFLCAACLRTRSGASARRREFHLPWTSVAVLSSFLLVWLLFFVTSQILSFGSDHATRAVWQAP